MSKGKISVALGGGGIRGNAHIGVLRRLEKLGYKIEAVAGTSAGGLVGALYAAGLTPDEIEEKSEGLDQAHLFGRTAEDGPALLGLAGVRPALETLLGKLTFDDLKKPFAVTAVDIHAGKEVVVNSGRVVDALLATIALPGMLPPHEREGRLLVDGGVLNPVPVTVVRWLAPLLPVVAVVLNPEWHTEAETPHYISGPAPVMNRLNKWRITQALDLAFQAVELGSIALSELRLLLDKPDVIIRPNVTDVGMLTASDVGKLVLRGEEAVIRAAEELERALTVGGQVKRRLRYGRLLTTPGTKKDA